MDYSLRYLKRREIFPVKVAKVEWNQASRVKPTRTVSQPHSPRYSSHRPTTTPFFTRKMTQFVRKNEVSQCLKIINMLKKLQCEEDLRMAIIGNSNRSGHPFREGFPMRESWRLRSAKLQTKQPLQQHERTAERTTETTPLRPRSTHSTLRAKSATLH